jgi:hypothetical protein
MTMTRMSVLILAGLAAESAMAHPGHPIGTGFALHHLGGPAVMLIVATVLLVAAAGLRSSSSTRSPQRPMNDLAS